MNEALAGKGLNDLEASLTRLGRGGRLPHWHDRLVTDQSLPNRDGKTVGSVIEMLLVAVLETTVLKGQLAAPMRINPASGVDLPDLDLGVKSPSTNYCTSEPYFSAYERLLGSDHDALVLLTDYQEAKKLDLFKVSILKHRYLHKTQVADQNLCSTARLHRDFIYAESPATALRFFQFLAYVNQSDWLAVRLIRFLRVLNDEAALGTAISAATAEYARENQRRNNRGADALEETYEEQLKELLKVNPLRVGVLRVCDDWITENLGNAARLPNDAEANALMTGPLDGVISMSFALQWRYNFGSLFRGL